MKTWSHNDMASETTALSASYGYPPLLWI